MSEEKRTPMEEALIQAMQAIDRQIAREMQRSPAEESRLGVLKIEPFRKRVELIASLIINELGSDVIALDSILVLAEAFPKALQILAEDLGVEGLGKLRSQYCSSCFSSIEQSAGAGLSVLKEKQIN